MYSCLIFTDICSQTTIQAISSTSNSQTGSGYILFVLRLIDAIKFVHDYRERNKGEGGKKWVMRFRRREFQVLSASADKFVGLGEDDKDALMDSPEMKAKFEKWQRQNEVDVTAMNRMYDMYQSVSFGHESVLKYLIISAVRSWDFPQPNLDPTGTPI